MKGSTKLLIAFLGSLLLLLCYLEPLAIYYFTGVHLFVSFVSTMTSMYEMQLWEEGNDPNYSPWFTYNKLGPTYWLWKIIQRIGTLADKHLSD